MRIGKGPAGQRASGSGGERHAVVFLGSHWTGLRALPTRWLRVVNEWRRCDTIDTLTVVSLPTYRRRYLFHGAGALAWFEPSWLPDVLAVEARLPAGPCPGRLDAIGSWRLSRALSRILPGTAGTRAVIATHPIWAPVALSLPASRRGFDAYDDWRARAKAQGPSQRAQEGYGLLPLFDTVSAHSSPWASELRQEFGVEPVVLGNGIDLDAYLDPGPAPEGLPDEPFAVYVGSIEDRVNLSLMERLTNEGRIPVVVAGPADPATAARLRNGPLHWMGPVAPSQVPAVLGAASVGLLPHQENRFTRSMDPLKILEYLAAGLPVVSTRVPIPGGSEQFVHIADTEPEFIRQARDLVRQQRHVPRDYLATKDWRIVAQSLAGLHLYG